MGKQIYEKTNIYSDRFDDLSNAKCNVKKHKAGNMGGENIFIFYKGEVNIIRQQPIRLSSMQQSNHMLNSVKDGRDGQHGGSNYLHQS